MSETREIMSYNGMIDTSVDNKYLFILEQNNTIIVDTNNFIIIKTIKDYDSPECIRIEKSSSGTYLIRYHKNSISIFNKTNFTSIRKKQNKYNEQAKIKYAPESDVLVVCHDGFLEVFKENKLIHQVKCDPFQTLCVNHDVYYSAYDESSKRTYIHKYNIDDKSTMYVLNSYAYNAMEYINKYDMIKVGSDVYESGIRRIEDFDFREIAADYVIISDDYYVIEGEGKIYVYKLSDCSLLNMFKSKSSNANKWYICRDIIIQLNVGYVILYNVHKGCVGKICNEKLNFNTSSDIFLSENNCYLYAKQYDTIFALNATDCFPENQKFAFLLGKNSPESSIARATTNTLFDEHLFGEIFQFLGHANT
jgi:hypothetical protein